MKRCVALTLMPVLAVTGCIPPPTPQVLEPLPPVTGEGIVAPPRVNGSVGNPNTVSPVLTSTATPATLPLRLAGDTTSLGQITLDFADSDIREVASQILGAGLRRGPLGQEIEGVLAVSLRDAIAAGAYTVCKMLVGTRSPFVAE